MKHKKLMIVLITLCISASCHATNIEVCTKTRQRIFNQTKDIGGEMNPAIHKEFWDCVNIDGTNSDYAKDVLGYFSKAFTEKSVTHLYMKEFWKSMLLSYENKKITETEELLRLRPIMLQQLKDVSEVAFDENEYNKSKLKALSEEKDMLQAAANHSFYHKKGYPPAKIDLRTILLFKNEIDNVFTRMAILLDEHYYKK